jgi:hypothetical protein
MSAISSNSTRPIGRHFFPATSERNKIVLWFDPENARNSAPSQLSHAHNASAMRITLPAQQIRCALYFTRTTHSLCTVLYAHNAFAVR